MGTAKTFSQFLDYAVTHHPADNMSLILWGHGDGESVCFDQQFQYDSLNPREIRTALATLDTNVRFDTVAFDACHAATLDMAAALTGRATYMVASKDKLPGSGLDYSAIDFNQYGRQLAQTIATSLTTSPTTGTNPNMEIIGLAVGAV